VVAVFKRPTILCRQSSEDEHQFVVAMPDGSPPDAADRFAATLEIPSFRRLSGNRIAFTLAHGPALKRLLQRSFSGQVGGFPVVRALFHPESFPGEKTGCELEKAPKARAGRKDPPVRTGKGRVHPRSFRLGTAVAVGVAFLLGMLACGILNEPHATRAGADAKRTVAREETRSPVAVDLGTLVTAYGPTAVFQSEDGSLRYAFAGGSLEGRLRPDTEIYVEPGIEPALFVPVRELRDTDGAYVFHRQPAMNRPPDLEHYGSSLVEALRGETPWVTAEDSTRTFYDLRTTWRVAGEGPQKLEGIPEVQNGETILRAGPISIRLAGLDDVDHLNLSMATGRVHVFGVIDRETSWHELRHDPSHPAFVFRVDWIEPGDSQLLCSTEQM
jgi:hypothetical protein